MTAQKFNFNLFWISFEKCEINLQWKRKKTIGIIVISQSFCYFCNFCAATAVGGAPVHISTYAKLHIIVTYWGSLRTGELCLHLKPSSTWWYKTLTQQLNAPGGSEI